MHGLVYCEKLMQKDFADMPDWDYKKDLNISVRVCNEDWEKAHFYMTIRLAQIIEHGRAIFCNEG